MIFLKIIKIIIISCLVTLGIFRYAPLAWLETTSDKNIGSTITTIQATDRLSDSRSVINTNFSNLNSDKIEATQTTLNSLTSASALATVGTITSGTWSATAIAVNKGGTGTTTPSLFNVLLGSSTNGLGIVNGLGNSGQFLTSQGTGLPPQWTTASLDLTASYSWTGTNSFSGTNTFIKNFAASSTSAFPITLNGLTYSTPSARAASSTVLMEDGTGALKWQFASGILASSFTPVSVTNTTASTTITTFTIPANALTGYGILHLKVFADVQVESSGMDYFEVDYGSNAIYIQKNAANYPINGAGWVEIWLMANGTGAQVVNIQQVGLNASDAQARLTSFASYGNNLSTDSTQAQTFSFVFRTDTSTANRFNMKNYYAEVIR